jgi:hypothetical protein
MMEYRTMICKYINQKDVLLDGRPITFLSRELGYNREHLSLVLSGKEPCTPTLAKKIVERLKPNEKVEDYFEEYEG